MLGLAAGLAVPSWAQGLSLVGKTEEATYNFAQQARDSAAGPANREKAVQAELRRGLDRLNKICVSPAAPNVAQKQLILADLLDRELRDFDRIMLPLSEKTARLSAEADRRRAQACPVLQLLPKNLACRQAEDVKAGLATLIEASARRRVDLTTRYNLYAEAEKLEARSCASAGFTQRLVQADDQFMRPISNQALDDWGRLLNAAEASFR